MGHHLNISINLVLRLSRNQVFRIQFFELRLRPYMMSWLLSHFKSKKGQGSLRIRTSTGKIKTKIATFYNLKTSKNPKKNSK